MNSTKVEHKYKKNVSNWNFQNSYLELPNKLYSKQLPIAVKNPEMHYINDQLAIDIGLETLLNEEDLFVAFLSGNKIPNGAMPISQAYAGHQFGNFTMLGDGRAVLLGEQITKNNLRYDIQLKGSGITKYSRNGDGRATLYSMLREYLISESMYYLGIPTTRSLSVVKTGEKVYREKIYEGGILTRVASSHIRVGTFEYLLNYCTRDDLEIFMNYVINRHYPEIKKSDNIALELLKVVMSRQIDLIINWSRVGFIHGVMNTDNMSIVGETIDYGPCAFMNTYNPKTVFSSIDRYGRYSFENQSKIANWNLAVFASTLLPFISSDKQEAIELVEHVLYDFKEVYSEKWYAMMCKKLGIFNPVNEDKILVDSLLKLMEQNEADYTNTFAILTQNTKINDQTFKLNEFKKWYQKWEKRINQLNNRFETLELMKNHNPLFIPRNHLVEIALEKAIKGDKSKFSELLNMLSKTYDYEKNEKNLQSSPTGFDDSYQTYCGT